MLLKLLLKVVREIIYDFILRASDIIINFTV